MPQPVTPDAPAASPHRSVAGLLRSLSAQQCYCLAVGTFLLVRGLSTLAAGASFALPGDGWRAIFQLLVAGCLLLAMPARRAADRAVIGVGALYAVISVVGIVDGHDLLGVIPVDSRDKVVHASLAIVALALGARALARPRRPSGV